MRIRAILVALALVSIATSTATSATIHVLAGQRHYLQTSNPGADSADVVFLTSVPMAGKASLRAFNSLGQVVADVFDGSLPAGNYTFTWKPAQVASGLYLMRATTGSQGSAKRILYLK